MKKVVLLGFALCSYFNISGQTQPFDKLKANKGSNKEIEWFTSGYGNGFGHRIYNHDPGGKTLLNFAGRHNSSSWTDILTLTSHGRVGIGTTNPGSYKLYVNGNSYVNGSLTFPAVADDGTKSRTHLSFPVKTDGFYISTQQLSRDKMEVLFKLRDNTTGDSFRMWFDDYRGAEHDRNPFIVYGDRVLLASDGGNVGIGTPNPSSLLELNANETGDAILKIEADSDNAGSEADNARIEMYQDAKLIGAKLGFNEDVATPSNHFQIDMVYPSGIYENALTINPYNGKIGLGVFANSEDALLVVDGKIMAEEVKVQAVPSSDFVFEPEYQLRPLEEVDAFIRENKHLPDIPSAAEFKENGVGLGEMDNMLLQKIEELTLYVIELKKENEELKADNIAIKDGLLKELETIKAQLR
jgi:hypothetical protein